MKINEYVKNASTTRAMLRDKKLDNLHMTLGLITETGELADVFKKSLAYDKEIDWVNVKEEIGDLMWYIAGLCDINNFDLEDILKTNINKLKTRYPDRFDKVRAVKRNLEKERETLES